MYIMSSKIKKLAKKLKTYVHGPTRGAGILFVCSEDNTALLALRSKHVLAPDTWGVPGGKVKKDETFFETGAVRETKEEFGSIPKDGTLIDSMISEGDGWIYKTFIINIPLSSKDNWKIKLNYEHTEYKWFPMGELPDNLHHVINMIKY
jgi:8-oxo-dGTP pyrophosphatase MutT (NUDIX family)